MSSPPSTGPTPGPLSTLDVRRVAAGGVGPSIMGFLGGGGPRVLSNICHFFVWPCDSFDLLRKHDGGYSGRGGGENSEVVGWAFGSDPFRREMSESTTMSPPVLSRKHHQAQRSLEPRSHWGLGRQ